MAYYIDLFSPETYEAFSNSSRDISGFRQRQENSAKRVNIGDKFICYVTKLSRWFGILEVTSQYFMDSTPIFYAANDPFIVRFRVKEIVWLPVEKGIPIRDPRVWQTLSFTKNLIDESIAWTGKVRNSLNRLEDNDGKFLEEFILRQSLNGEIFDIDPQEYGKHLTHKVQGLNNEVIVSVPQEAEINDDAATQPEVRESIKMQAALASIGSKMGLKIWLPKGDRNAVLTEWGNENGSLLDKLPLNYDEATLRTIEQIDVIWLRGRAIVRAFEVEHTTSIYSGILRMADLLALQPNMNISLHIVSPDARREKVFQEIRRPVFSLLEAGPLSEKCTYLSYDSIKEILDLKHLAYLSDNVLDEYSEEAE
jgi:hypothetical protein